MRTPLLACARADDIGHTEDCAERDALGSTRHCDAVRLQVLDMGAAGESDMRRGAPVHSNRQRRGDIRDARSGRHPDGFRCHCVRIDCGRHGLRKLGKASRDRYVDQVNTTRNDDVSHGEAGAHICPTRPQHHHQARFQVLKVRSGPGCRSRETDTHDATRNERVSNGAGHRFS
jgi:hypothetical protein